ncbi:galactokinase [bacterium]|nr:galactokinase [bacterium]
MLNIQRLNSIFKEIYAADNGSLKTQFQRYENLIVSFKNRFSEQDIHLFSTPGRTEIGGNHTDHNQGQVLAASIHLDSVAAAAKNNSNQIVIYSEGYQEPFIIELSHLEVVEKEKVTTSALIRGIAARMKQLGYNIGGFHACITSSVLPGSGLSSSASIEILIGSIMNALFNENKITPEILAVICQYAENIYFGKPCGLMDQMTCAVGGIIRIDFKNPEQSVVQKVDFKLDDYHYSLLVVNTGGNHADLTDEYAAIPSEMKTVAHAFDAEVMRDVPTDRFFNKIPELRKQAGDRAVLRAFHFLHEHERVSHQVKALEEKNFQKFICLIRDSGNSSYKWLQNIYASSHVREQGVSLALALTENYLNKIQTGACRIHGGGFSGTIQVFMPKASVSEYSAQIRSIFGEESVSVLSIRPCGTLYLNPYLEE